MKHVKQTLAILLTLLMLVSAVPFAAFATELTAEQKACTHEWDPNIDTKAEYLYKAATCSHAARYYQVCKKCKACAKDVSGAEDKILEIANGPKDATNHEGPMVPAKPEAVDMKPCQKADTWTPGEKCSACGVETVAPVHNTVMQNHKVAEGQEANCMSAGYCQWCGEKIAEIDKNNHAPDQIRVQQQGVEPTCGKAGQKAILYCRNCDKVFQNADVIPPTGKHTPKTAATCSKRAVCATCDQEYGEKDPTNHTLEKRDAVSVSCTTDGSKEYWECKDCHKFFEDKDGKKEITDKESVKIKADGKTHKSLKKVEAKAATCSATGIKEHWYCDACKHYYSDKDGKTEINQADTVEAKKEHTWGEWKYPENYKCEDGGEVSRTCTKCGFVEKKTANKGEHVDRKTEKGVEATCTTAGKTDKIYCGKCGVVLQESKEIPALNHDYTGAKATGKGDGTHTLLCTRCQQPGEPETCIDGNNDCKCDICGQQLAHKFTNYVSDGNATCAADGTKTAVCDVCGKEKDTVPDVGSMTPTAHQYEWTDLNNASCLKNAEKKGVCKICGAVVTQEIPDTALNHIPSDWQYPDGFDCLQGGNRFKVCTRCGKQIEFEAIEGRDHSEVIDPGVKKTCTVDGKSDGSHCAVCGKILTAQIIYPAEGHKADEKGFVTTRAVTCTVDGIQTATCGVCGETFTRTIPATGHNYVDTVVKPTCTGKGYTLHTCTVCGEKKQDNFTSATGHKMVQTITPATMDSNGKVVLVCSVCGKKQADKVYRIKKITLSQTTFVRDSKKHKPSVTITDTKGNKLTKNTDYTLKYSSGRKAVGTYKVTVTFKGEYKGKKTLSFKIVPPAVKGLKATAGAKRAALSWARNKFADVYVVYCATAKDGKYKKLATTDKLTYTATKLTSGKTYYFKVVAVRKLDSGNYYSADSAIKKITVK